MSKRKQPKQQVVLKVAGRSFTRHVKDGKIRSIECEHGVTCKKCFVEVAGGSN